MEIQIRNATKTIKGSIILNSISLNLQGGMIYGLKGINGSGKTMLMRLISGLIRPDSGSVIVNGKELGKDLDFPESIGLLLENPAFLPSYTGFQNLLLLARLKGKVDSFQVQNALIDVGLNPNDPRKFRKYSLGMKQRLGIAAAVMEQPDLILLDEPTNALDSEGIKTVYNIMLRERERGALIIFTCHDDTLLYQLSDQVLKVDSGTVTEA